jgi:TIR domain
MTIDPEFTEVFISHSSQDADRASALAEFLSACLRLKDYAITCTSAPGFSLPIGAKFEDSLRLSIKKCDVFVGLVSEHSLGSLFCTMEMGAAWGRKKPLKLVLAPGVNPASLQRPLSSFHMVQWVDPKAWFQLAEEVADETGADRRNTKRWIEFAEAISTDQWSNPSLKP